MLADALVSALKGFAQEVATWTNQGSILSIEGHIAQIENAVATDVHAGETAAKAVLADLYSAFHGYTPAEPVAVPPQQSATLASTSLPSGAGPAALTPQATSPNINIPDVTAQPFASGGLVPPGQAVVVGEGGSPALIVPPAPAADPEGTVPPATPTA